jgi:hypothetical protein
MMNQKSEIPAGVTMRIETVELASLQIDTSYQRGLKANARKIAQNLSPCAVGTLHVGERADGSRFVIDGQQRRWALMETGHTHWKAYVIRSDGPDHEAAIFALLNGGRTGLTPQEIFRSRALSNDSAALAVLRALEANGLEPYYSSSGNTVWGKVRSLTPLYKLVITYGEDKVRLALDALIRSWPEDPDTMRSVVLVPFVHLYCVYASKIDHESLVQRLRRATLITLIQAARKTRNVMTAMEAQLAKVYNARRLAKNRIGTVVIEQAPVAAAEDGDE